MTDCITIKDTNTENWTVTIIPSCTTPNYTIWSITYDLSGATGPTGPVGPTGDLLREPIRKLVNLVPKILQHRSLKLLRWRALLHRRT
jgi:hypothetical protein